MLITEKIEKTFIDILQHDIVIMFNKKVLKSGKLLLLNHKSTVISLTLQLPNSSDIKTYELPYPFKFEYSDDNNEKQVIFDYNFNIICPPSINSLPFDNISPQQKQHRFLSNKVYIKCID